MAESAVATKTSSDKAPAAPQPAAPEKVRAGGPTMQGMSPQEMQQRFGNAGTAQAIAEQEVVLSPFEAIAPAREGVADRARTSKRHPEASVPVDAAQDAAIEAPVEQKRGAASKTVTEIDKVETKEIKRSAGDGFEAELRAALLAAVPIPENEDEAKATIEKGGSDASATLRGGVDSEGNKTGPLADATAEAAPLEEATSVEAEAKPEDQDAPEEVELATEKVGDAPASVASDSVVPPPISDSKLDYSDHSASTDQVMAENEITDEQLAKGNEPEFNETLGTKEEAANHAQSGAEAFRESEAGTRESAGSKASKTMAGGLTGFHSSRTNEIGDVVDTQDSTKSEDERERRRITNKIVKVKDDTQEDVEKILDKMEEQASTRFEIGLADAEKAYEKSFDDNLGGINFFGAFRIGEDTDRAFRKGREAYETKVDTAITAVVRIVNAALKRAERRVAKGKKEVDDFVEGLDESVKQFGVEAQESVAADFDEMESSIESRKSGLIETLVAQYQASQERVAAMEERLRLENMSIWDRIYEQTVGLAKKILEFKDLLLSILGEAGEVVKAIIADPIAFLKNLIAGIVGGLNLFKDNIVEHLKGGLMGWLVGSLQSAGLELPTSFDLKGIFQLIFGILGVTYGIIREKAVKLLGEKVVGRLEQTAEIFIVLATEGPAGVWQMFVEQMGDVKEMIMGEIRGFVIEKIIIAGITWLISLLNPASAFFKACKAIYDIVMFFIERGQQIMELVNTIIGAIGEIVAGNVEGMSKAVENVLARLLPVAISFLASLLGLGGITDKIREIVDKIRDKVDAVVDWIIAKAVKLAQKIGDLLPGGKERKAKRKAEAAKEVDYDDPEKEAKVTAALADIPIKAENYGGSLTDEEVELLIAEVRDEHPILSSLTAENDGEFWLFHYTASPRGPAAKVEVENDWPDAPRVLYKQGTVKNKEDASEVGSSYGGTSGYVIDKTGNAWSAALQPMSPGERKPKWSKLDSFTDVAERKAHILNGGSRVSSPNDETKQAVLDDYKTRTAAQDEDGKYYLEDGNGIREEVVRLDPVDGQERKPPEILLDRTTGRPMRDYSPEQIAEITAAAPGQERETLKTSIEPEGAHLDRNDPQTINFGHTPEYKNEFQDEAARRVRSGYVDDEGTVHPAEPGYSAADQRRFAQDPDHYEAEGPNRNQSHHWENNDPMFREERVNAIAAEQVRRKNNRERK